MPFGEYRNFKDCVRKNRDKGNPRAYCGYIKHQIEGNAYDPDTKVSFLARKPVHIGPGPVGVVGPGYTVQTPPVVSSLEPVGRVPSVFPWTPSTSGGTIPNLDHPQGRSKLGAIGKVPINHPRTDDIQPTVNAVIEKDGIRLMLGGGMDLDPEAFRELSPDYVAITDVHPDSWAGLSLLSGEDWEVTEPLTNQAISELIGPQVPKMPVGILISPDYPRKQPVITQEEADLTDEIRPPRKPGEINVTQEYAPDKVDPSWVQSFELKKEPIRIEPFRITPFLISATTEVPALGLRIETDDAKLWFSNGMLTMNSEDMEEAFRDLDIAILGGTSIEEDTIWRDNTGSPHGLRSIAGQVKFIHSKSKPVFIINHLGESPQLPSIDERRLLCRITGCDINRIFIAGPKYVVNAAQARRSTWADSILHPIVRPEDYDAGMILVKPYGTKVMTGEKTIVVKGVRTTKYIEKRMLLIEDKKAIGIIELEDIREIDKNEFSKLRDKHLIPEEDRQRWWGDRGTLYAYTVHIIKDLGSIPVRIPRGPQAWVHKENIDLLPQDLSSDQALLAHVQAHLDWDPVAHEEALTYIEELGLVHVHHNRLDDLTQLIKSIEDYDPSKVSDAVLTDDHRILHAWSRTLDTKRKPFSGEGWDDMTITEQLKRVRSMHDDVADEMLVRKMDHRTPITRNLEMRIPRIDKIDSVYLGSLKDPEVTEVHNFLHDVFDREVHRPDVAPRSYENIVNAHAFVWQAMNKRGMNHPSDPSDYEDDLDRRSAFAVQEYPAPGNPSEIKSLSRPDDALSLEEVLNMFPTTLNYEAPEVPEIWLSGGMVNRGWVRREGGPGEIESDLDVVIKSPKRDPLLEDVIRSSVDAYIGHKLHFVWDPDKDTMMGLRVPLFKPKLNRVVEIPLAQVSISPFKKFKPEKSSTGLHKNEFFSEEDLWSNWAKSRIDRGIIIQEKFDGMRFLVHKEGGRVQFLTEDRNRDRAEFFPKSKAELSHVKAKSFIIDCEMVEYDGAPKESNNQVPREDMIPWIVASRPSKDDSNVIFHVFDCLYQDGQQETDDPYSERLGNLKDLIPKGLVHWQVADSHEVDNPKAFFSQLKHVSSIKNSEGAMLKTADSKYFISSNPESVPRNRDWAKFKSLKEIDVLVLEKMRPESKETGEAVRGSYYYWAAIGPVTDTEKWSKDALVEFRGKTYMRIGKTYNTRISIDPGDILTILVGRIRRYEGKDGKPYLTWMHPNVEAEHPDKKVPDTIETAEKIEKVGTGRLSEVSELSIQVCPFYKAEDVCPLHDKFERPWMENRLVDVEYLKYPIGCPHASRFRCPYLKDYYYDTIQLEVPGELTEEEKVEDANDPV